MSDQDQDLVIVATARTPFGSFQGQLASFTAPRLGALAIEGALKRAGLDPSKVSEVYMGEVLTAGVGQAPARQAALYAGLPDKTPCTTINKVCGSGMKAIMLGAQSLKSGDAQVVVAGGQESMTQAPYLMAGARGGFRMGDQALLDSMISDGLWDPYGNQHMGNFGDKCASEKKFSREEQDAFAVESFKRSQAAQKAGKFASEIVSVEVKGRRGDVVRVEHDEGPGKAQLDKIPSLRPAFSKDGSVTAANASSINDGAAAVVLTTGAGARDLGLKPLARIVSYGQFAQAPEWFTTAPAGAMKNALDKAGWKVSDVDLFEVNEAFAVVTLAAMRELEIPHNKMNIWGGAISLGHPIGASGARIVSTLIYQLRDLGLKRGCAGICIGGGEATSVCIELLN